MSRNTIVVAECKNCGRDFRDGTVAERLHSKYCPTCQRAYSEAVDDFYNIGIMEQLKNKDLAR
jgi:predicted Zn-ribbon and HTH transcriptional regulator|nr:MAG TPA: LysW biosynthesis protein LysW [Bacteriophage sp.]